MAQMRLSASRLNEYLGCAHRAALRLAGVSPSDEADASQKLVQQKGFEHEAFVLRRLEREFGRAVTIPRPEEGSLEQSLEQTRRAMADGATIIYQAALASERWIGYPDFLIRQSDGAYTPEDAKLARRAKAEHLLQLGIYAQLLKETAGIAVANGAIHVSGGTPQVFDLRQTIFVTNRLMAQFDKFASTDPRDSRPLKCAACARCEYKSRCESEWRVSDSPIFVAGMRVEQQLKLERAGVTTMTALADLADGTNIYDLNPETLAKLRDQARLQKSAGGKLKYETRAVSPGRGFTLLPPSNPSDIFLDLEGDPLVEEGLEYLFGTVELKDSTASYQSVWAHDHPSERQAFEQVLQFLFDRMTAHPAAHIYHYGHYEEAAFKRLAMKYATKEAELDELLRTGRFVNLLGIVRQGLRLSTESISLKAIEGFYWNERSGDVATALDSIVQYERWRVEQDPALLAQIADYNKDDCFSTFLLRDWLQNLRPQTAVYGLEEVENVLDTPERKLARQQKEEERQGIAAAIRASNASNARVRSLVTELLWFHQRSQKPRWWAIFDRKTWSDDELTDDPDSLGGLRRDPDVPQETVKRSFQVRFEFEPQDTKLKIGSRPRIALTATPAGEIQELDAEAGVVVLKRGKQFGDFPLECSLSPEGPIKQTEVLIEAVAAFGRRFADGNLDGDRALLDFLERARPRIKGIALGAALVGEAEDAQAATVRLVSNLDQSTLFVQGPPGTGKTRTASHAVLALVQAGHRVAVSSNSHKAINNLLEEIEDRATEANYSFVGAKKGTAGDEETFFDGEFIKTVTDSEAVSAEHRVVGATAFHFAKDALNSYDYLVIDEAGQVSVGNLVAMAGCAKNLVLVGDQMQLSQPIQGVHPGESGLSTLEYLLEGKATVPPDQGVLLNLTYRLHPAICSLVSDAIYDSRLHPAPDTARRVLRLNARPHAVLREAGIAFLTLEHAGCSQSSEEEVDAIQGLVDDLIRHEIVALDGSTRQVAIGDILVVAPYNMQVNRLKRALPEACEVGTVDKFQGQQKPIVIVSMTTSSGNDAPRGTGFLFSRNRFNVAISRAQTLAVVVQSSRLQDVDVSTIEDLVRLNLFARAEQDSMEAAVSERDQGRADNSGTH